MVSFSAALNFVNHMRLSRSCRRDGTRQRSSSRSRRLLADAAPCNQNQGNKLRQSPDQARHHKSRDQAERWEQCQNESEPGDQGRSGRQAGRQEDKMGRQEGIRPEISAETARMSAKTAGQKVTAESELERAGVDWRR